MVAVPVSLPDQHSPRLGQRASSHTVWSFSSRSLALMAAYLAPLDTVSFIHLGLGSGRCRVPTSTEYMKGLEGRGGGDGAGGSLGQGSGQGGREVAAALHGCGLEAHGWRRPRRLVE